MSEQLYTFSWGNNAKRLTLKGRRCRILAVGTMNTVMVEFTDNGEVCTVSRRALRKVKLK